MNRGEIWWAASPGGKRRPYLVLTRQAAIGRLHSVLAVPATTTVRQIPTEVGLNRADGMPSPCALSFDNLTLMPKSLLTERITRLSLARMEDVCRAVRVATGC
ncbi:MAG: type II toxin-antitoxin system PemK/MazF family toxin [Acidimicrobiia bacterium]|nr:type II toxin-antitoxin system PemK/MazF family toxin [Acidimicrobiia bacterium]